MPPGGVVKTEVERQRSCCKRLEFGKQINPSVFGEMLFFCLSQKHLRRSSQACMFGVFREKCVPACFFTGRSKTFFL